MKWIDDPPEDWESAPDEPPAVRTDAAVLEVERLTRGTVLRDPDTPRAYIYAYEGSVPLAERA